MPVRTVVTERRILRQRDAIGRRALHEERHRTIEDRHRLQEPNPRALIPHVDIEPRPHGVAVVRHLDVAIVMENDEELILQIWNDFAARDRATRAGPTPAPREPVHVTR